jgi:hypothetical protein
MLKGRGDDKSPVEIGAHESRLSVSHAAFNSAGQLATASYDDTVKIYDFSSVGTLSSDTELNDEQMTPTTIIPHNNQTGRWVTMYVSPSFLSPSSLFKVVTHTHFHTVFAHNGNSNPPTTFNVSSLET